MVCHCGEISFANAGFYRYRKSKAWLCPGDKSKTILMIEAKCSGPGQTAGFESWPDRLRMRYDASGEIV